MSIAEDLKSLSIANQVEAITQIGLTTASLITVITKLDKLDVSVKRGGAPRIII